MSQFNKCEICSADDWRIVYKGSIRDGHFGSTQDNGVVAQCNACGVQRLAERNCPSSQIYETDEYRTKLKAGIDAKAYFSAHDELQIFSHQAIWPTQLRDLSIADVGCAGGSFLDSVRGMAKDVIGIEPFSEYRTVLSERGIESYPYVADALYQHAARIDLATSFQVIEHVKNPLEFLLEIKALMKSDGLVVLSTPNRDDILMSLLPGDFRPFFYRVVHRWYFEEKSLGALAKRAGYKIEQIKYVHRYGMSNTLSWLKDRTPKGQERLGGINPMADGLWKTYLENTGQSDTIFVTLSIDATKK